MNKVSMVLLILMVSTLFYIGAMVYYEMATEIENNPDIKEIGGPPVFTDLRLVLIITVVAVVFCGVLLRYSKEKESNGKE